MTPPAKSVSFPTPTKSTKPTPPPVSPLPKLPPQPPAPKARTTKDYREPLVELAQIPTFIFASLGKWRKNPAFALDAVTVQLHAPNVADSLNDLAQENDLIASVLDWATTAGPYAALLTALVPLAAQFAANHEVIPTDLEMGILPPVDLIAELQRRQSGKR